MQLNLFLKDIWQKGFSPREGCELQRVFDQLKDHEIVSFSPREGCELQHPHLYNNTSDIKCQVFVLLLKKTNL